MALYTQLLHKKIIGYMAVGASIEVAARAAGVSGSTLRNWMARGAMGEEPYATLQADAEVARAQYDVCALGLIVKAGETQWQAPAWVLERTRPERYRRRDPVRDETERLQQEKLRLEIAALSAGQSGTRDVIELTWPDAPSTTPQPSERE